MRDTAVRMLCFVPQVEDKESLPQHILARRNQLLLRQAEADAEAEAAAGAGA